MKKIDMERVAIVRSLDRSPNITVAAQDLGASRRTLQARMRDHGIPPGKAGRPRTLLPHRPEMIDEGSLAIALLGAVGLGAWWLWRRHKAAAVPSVATAATPSAAASAPSELAGIDILSGL